MGRNYPGFERHIGKENTVSDTPHTWTARAFAPAHLTGFFETQTAHANPYRKGSRGAGLNLELGVTATVTVDDTRQGRQVTINGVLDPAEVVHTTLVGLLGDEYPAAVDVALVSELPSGQGFGLSGAGALATGTALARLLGFAQKTAVWEAHRAEVLHRTGLGDVAAQALGGAEMRITAGPMPMGVMERFAGREARHFEVICCVLDAPLSTRAVLDDPEALARINAAGAAGVDQLRAEPTLVNYMAIASAFTAQAGLADDRLLAALETARQYGPAAQTMLGNALHLLLDTRLEDSDPVGAIEALEKHGRVYQSRIASRGAQVLTG